MRKILSLLALLAGASAFGQNSVTVTASHIYSNYPANFAQPSLLPSGVAVFQATNASGVPISYQVGGGGVQTKFPTTCAITVGTIVQPCSLANVATANPANFCYQLTIKNSANQIILGGLNSGYQCLQPTVTNTWCSAATCDLDNFQPTVPQSTFTLQTPTNTTLGGIYADLCPAGQVSTGYAPTGLPVCIVQTSGGSGTWGAIAGTITNQTDLITILNAKAPLASPPFTGTPTAPTPNGTDNSTRLATTAFVAGTYAPITSPALLGTPTAPTPGSSDSSTKIATTAYVQSQGYIPGLNAALTGIPTAPTAAANTNTTQIATTAFVIGQGYVQALNAALTGTPTSTTPTISDSSTKIATTAWVNEQGFGTGGGNVSGPGGSTVNDVVLMGGTNGKSIIDATFGFPLAPAHIGTLVAGSNGLANSATTDATNASNISSGTLPHARLPALLSGDIPNNGANTTGSAGSLSAVSALPAGTSATTQTTSDSTTAVATDAFVKNQGYGQGTLLGIIAGAGLTGGGSSGSPTLSLATALPGGTTATTQTTGDNSAKIATDAFVIANAGGGPTLGTAAQFPIVNSGATAYAPQTMSGDCSMTVAGVVTCLKAGGVSLGPFATQASPCTAAQGCNGLNTSASTGIGQWSAGTYSVSNTILSALTIPGINLNSNALTNGTTGAFSGAVNVGSLIASTTVQGSSFSWQGNVAANQIFGNCTGSAASPTICAITNSMLPSILTANTSGTAANLSGTPALPNGATATTQTTGDNTTKIATDAFVIANAGTVYTGSSPIVVSGSSISCPTCGTSTGNVTVSGTPANTQLAAWVSGTAIQGLATLPATNFPALTGDVNGSSGSLGTTVVGINSVKLSTLATGLLKNTTATGVPVIASAGTDYVVPAGSITGTAANLSGTPTLPTGTAAATQAVGDSTAKLATDAFVQANNGVTTVTAGTGLTGGGTPSGSGGVTLNLAVALPNGETATTQTTGDNTTKVATDAFVLANVGSGNVSNVATPTNGQLAQWTGATTIQGVTILPTTAEPAHTGDATNSAGSLSMTVKGINGTLVSGLATGLLKNTTATGIPSIAVAGTDYVIPSGTVANATNAVSATSATTAGNLSGTPALPNGVTATTQTTGDNTTKIATDAFVIANLGSSVPLGTAAQFPVVNTGATSYVAQSMSGDANMQPSGSVAVTSTHIPGTTLNALSKFTGGGNIVSSSITDNGTTVSITEPIAIGSTQNWTLSGANATAAYTTQAPNLTSAATFADIWVGSGSSPFTETITPYPLVGTDSNILTAGTVSGAGNALCTDAQLGATTVGCPTASVPNPFHAAGQVSTPQLGNNTVYVDGTVNTSLAAALFSAPCFGANTHGCVIVDDFPETFLAWPMLQSQNVTIEFSQGINPSNTGGNDAGKWRTAVPIVIAGDRIVGHGWPNGQTLNGTNGTVIKACGRSVSGCLNTTYSPNKVPVLTATPTGTPSTTGGSLAAGTYFIKWVPIVNLDTAPDSVITTVWPVFPAITAVYAGQSFNDATTNCTGGTPCTEVVITAGTTGSSAPSWAGSVTGKTTSGTAVFVNVGNFSVSAGAVGVGAVGPESAAITTTGTTGSISLPVPVVPSYPACSRSSITYTTGQMVTGPFGTNTHSYRAVGTGTTTGSSCNMVTTAGSETQDAGASTLYWQETGAVNNFLPVKGYVPYIGTASGLEYSQATAGTINGTCTSTIQIANQVACQPGSTFTFQTYVNNNSRPTPLADTTATLGMMELATNTSTQSGIDNPNTRFENLWMDSDNIASECITNNAGQEGSGEFRVKCSGGDVVPIAHIAPNAQNSSFDDINIGNESSVGSTFQYQSLAGCVFIDARGGNAVKKFGEWTCIPLAAPVGLTPARGIYEAGVASVSLGIGLGGHHEVQIDGNYFDSGNSTLIGIDAANTVTNALVHLASGVNSSNLIQINAQGSGIAVQDDNVAAGTGNCNATNSNCWTGAGSYLLGAPDSNTNQSLLTTFPGAQNRFNGGIKTASIQTFNDCASVASPAVCGNATTGSAVIAVGATQVVINTTKITANSEVQLTPTEAIGSSGSGKLSVICNTTAAQALATLGELRRIAGTSITIGTSAASIATNPVCFHWQITN